MSDKQRLIDDISEYIDSFYIPEQADCAEVVNTIEDDLVDSDYCDEFE